MKRYMYIYASLFFILIVTLSFSWKGIMRRYEASYSTTEPVMKQYSVLNGKYQFELPESWKFTKGLTAGGEVLYTADFLSPDNRVRGVVQAWNIGTPLKEFLERSRYSSVTMADIKNYKMTDSQIGVHRGYTVSYSGTGNDGQVYRAVEYFVPVNQREFFRISFFVKEQNFTEELEKLFENIASTLKIKK